MSRRKGIDNQTPVSRYFGKLSTSLASQYLIVYLETDKATIDLESTQQGQVLYLAEKEVPLAVGSIMVIIGEAGEDISGLLHD